MGAAAVMAAEPAIMGVGGATRMSAAEVATTDAAATAAEAAVTGAAVAVAEGAEAGGVAAAAAAAAVGEAVGACTPGECPFVDKHPSS
jgi:hypothetical protein